jgi:hypothetical protein
MPDEKNVPDLQKSEGKESSPKKPAEKYWEVYFLDKRDESELEYHYLAVNGEALQVTKGTTVIIPERFLVVADNATIKKYKRGKAVGEVSRCPYRKIGKSTKAEYLKMKREGTKKHNEEIENTSRANEKQLED